MPKVGLKHNSKKKLFNLAWNYNYMQEFLIEWVQIVCTFLCAFTLLVQADFNLNTINFTRLIFKINLIKQSKMESPAIRMCTILLLRQALVQWGQSGRWIQTLLDRQYCMYMYLNWNWDANDFRCCCAVFEKLAEMGLQLFFISLFSHCSEAFLFFIIVNLCILFFFSQLA